MVRATEAQRTGIKTLLWLTDSAVTRIASANENSVLEHTTMSPLCKGVAVGFEVALPTEVGDVNLLALISDEELAREAATFAMARGTFSNYRAALSASRERCAGMSSRVISLCRDSTSNVLGRIHFNAKTWERITESEHMFENTEMAHDPSILAEYKNEVKQISGLVLDDWTEMSNGSGSSILELLHGAWTLYNSPMEMELTATTHTALTTSKPHRPGKGRARKTPDIEVIDVRRPAPHDHGNASAAAFDHDHRWTVRGHWRNQTCGPHGILRRKTWIEEHVRGPEDAPLVVRPKVWRI